MKVSVIIPAYRAEPFLAETLRSVAEQTYENWEVRIHENGLLDHSAEIIAEFSSQHPDKVFYTSSAKNLGVSRARNLLMDAAIGEVIAFLDADDMWRPDHLERALSAMTQSDADWYVSGMQNVDVEGQITGPTILPPEVATTDIAPTLLRKNFIPTTLAVLGPRAVQSRLRFDENLKVGEDLDLWIRFLQASLTPAMANKATILYRRHDHNTTKDPIFFAEEFTKVFEKHLNNTFLPPGDCLKGIEIMLPRAICMRRFRAPHRALFGLYRIWRARFKSKFLLSGSGLAQQRGGSSYQVSN